MDSLDRGKWLALANLSAVLAQFIIDSSASHHLLVTFTKKKIFSKHYQFIKALDSGKVNSVQRMDVRSRDMWVACHAI